MNDDSVLNCVHFACIGILAILVFILNCAHLASAGNCTVFEHFAQLVASGIGEVFFTNQ